MPTICGCLERIDHNASSAQWIQVRIVLAGGAPIRARAFVREHVFIARGTERIPLSDLREGELAEITYTHGSAGFLEADSIYVRPKPVTVSSQ